MSDKLMTRYYIHTTKAWWHKERPQRLRPPIVDQVDIRIGEDPDNPPELKIVWMRTALSDDYVIPAPHLHVTFRMINSLLFIQDVLLHLAQQDSTYLQPDEFCALLEQHGFMDLTPYEKPAGA